LIFNQKRALLTRNQKQGQKNQKAKNNQNNQINPPEKWGI
jgi:hypothetical protein